jgi:hypothetical protein
MELVGIPIRRSLCELERQIMNSYLSYTIPILTFLLGSALTLGLKRYDKRNSSLAIYARDLSDFANDWYNQLYEIRNADGSSQDFERKVKLYERNRIILPKFVRALEALRKYKNANRLVAEGERFLSVVTVSKERKGLSTFICRNCAHVLMTQEEFPEEQHYAGERGLVLLDNFVEDLDRHIQSINAEAGKIL